MLSVTETDMVFDSYDAGITTFDTADVRDIGPHLLAPADLFGLITLDLF